MLQTLFGFRMNAYKNELALSLSEKRYGTTDRETGYIPSVCGMNIVRCTRIGTLPLEWTWFDSLRLLISDVIHIYVVNFFSIADAGQTNKIYNFDETTDCSWFSFFNKN